MPDIFPKSNNNTQGTDSPADNSNSASSQPVKPAKTDSKPNSIQTPSQDANTNSNTNVTTPTNPGISSSPQSNNSAAPTVPTPTQSSPPTRPQNKPTLPQTPASPSTQTPTQNANSTQPNNQLNNSWSRPGNNFGSSYPPFSSSNFGNSFGNNQLGSRSDPYGSPSSSTPNSQKKLTPEERINMIKRLYKKVLGRKATTRDINYYKYSTLSEEQILKQLAEGQEHTQLIKNGKEYNKLMERLDTAESRVKKLEAQIKDELQEFKKLLQILKEKNRYIEELRKENQNPYNIPGQTLEQRRRFSSQIRQEEDSPVQTQNSSQSSENLPVVQTKK
ncbi:hypothetical protein GF357_01640 [Candidatus Dojkabacteria bacterium]|nr:hypothetical protein [Candidatus Dojkabacteria bacterium]